MSRVLVHADGGGCHGTPLVDGRCPACGIVPDMQSRELWDADWVRGYGHDVRPTRETEELVAGFRVVLDCHRAQERALCNLIIELNRMRSTATGRVLVMVDAEVEIAMAERNLLRAKIAGNEAILGACVGSEP